MTGDIQVPSALPLKLPSELTLGGEPLEASRSSQEGQEPELMPNHAVPAEPSQQIAEIRTA